jgi:hypothetical protein
MNLIQSLPKVKGLPADLEAKLKERKQILQASSNDWHTSRLEYLKTKIKFDILIDLSLQIGLSKSSPAIKVSPELIVSSSRWVQSVQDQLLNGKKSPAAKLSPEIIAALKETMLDLLLDRCTNLLNHWSFPDSSENNGYLKAKQLPIFVQADLETLKSNSNLHQNKVREIKTESQRKDLIKTHVAIARELMTKHALDHVSTLNRLQVDYTSAKKR